MQATAIAHPNIAFIKYWGNQNDALRLPVNGSLSMNLDGMVTQTTVRWDADAASDSLTLNGKPDDGLALARVSTHLDTLRARLGINHRAMVTSENNFPMGAGIASSASSSAALVTAAVAAAGATLSEREMTTLARLGSGSAARSIPAGFVEWVAAPVHEDSYAFTIAEPEHWSLVDIVAVVSAVHKAVGSTEGHPAAQTSPYQNARVAGAPERLDRCRSALLARDFASFAEVVEEDSTLMHAVMMTSRPPLFYWQPASLTLMEAVRRWRAEGLKVCFTLDAGPNVHCICTAEDADEIARRVTLIPGVQSLFRAGVGGKASVTG
jgi:diphosphomevalonate decarboxylase